MAGSPRGSLNSNDWKKIGKGTLVAAAGGGLGYASMHIDPSGVAERYSWVIVPMWSVVVNAAWKWLREQGYEGQ